MSLRTLVNWERIGDTITKTHLDILQLAIGINIDCLVLGGIIDKVGTHEKNLLGMTFNKILIQRISQHVNIPTS